MCGHAIFLLLNPILSADELVCSRINQNIDAIIACDGCLKSQLDLQTMPTYTVSALNGRLTDPQKLSLATALTDIHCQTTGAPKYFVQVIFVDVASNNYFIAGKRLEHDNIFVHAQIRAGRTLAIKHQLIDAIMCATANIAETDLASVQIYLLDLPSGQVAEWGRLLPQPGEEQAWDAATPADIRERMQKLLD